MNIRETNERALSTKMSDRHYEQYRELQEKELSNCYVERCENQENIICVLENERIWRLNSVYNPTKAAKLYAKRYNVIVDYAVICVFGISDGKMIRELLKNCNGTQLVIVYEPNVEVFLMAMRAFEIEDILSEKKVFLAVKGINGEELDKLLESVISFQNRELMMHCILPNYDVIYREECEAHIEKMLYSSHAEIFIKNTEVEFGIRFGNNILTNMPYILKGSSLWDLKQTFLQLNLEGIPAIVVSAGPSLDKNIKMLKKAEGKAFIIGVDSALKALTREGIQFQMAISVDPRKNPEVFNDDRVNTIPYVLASYSLPIISERNRNHLFFTDGYGFYTFSKLIAECTGKQLDVLKTGGSVATEALSMAIDFGFSKIILVGQDLAFTDGRGHVSGFEKSEEDDKAHVEKRRLVEVESIDGGRVMTDVQMNSYRQWFEMRIAENQDKIEFYNATEGGAKIRGATPITLEEVIKRFCTKEINFNKIVEEIQPAFTDEEQEKLLEELYKAPVYLNGLMEKLQDGIKAYQELIILEKKGMHKTKQYQEVLKRISEVNHIEQNEIYMALIKLYSKKSEYDAAGDIYVAEELSIEEIADRGIKLLEGYIEGCKVAKIQIETIMIPRLKELL